MNVLGKSRFLAMLAAGVLSASLVALPGTALAVQDSPAVTAPVGTGEDAPAVPGDPTEPSTPDDSSTPDEPSDVDAAPEPDEVFEPLPVVDADARARTVDYVGSIQHLSHDHDADSGTVRVIRVDGLGLLVVDIARIPQADDLVGAGLFTIELPAGIELTGDGLTDLVTLNDYQTEHGAFTATALGTPQRLGARGNVHATTPTVHKITAVLSAPRYHSVLSGGSAVSGDGPTAAGQTAADVQAAITYADEFWNRQSAGKVRFELNGTVTAFQRHASYSCHTMPLMNGTNGQNFATFMNNEATRSGFTSLPGHHLVVFFPATTKCAGFVSGGALQPGILGLGEVGWSPNDSGRLWSIGSNSNDGKATLAHELGHNLSFGHADWIDCSAAAPVMTSPVTYPSNCGSVNDFLKRYGDKVDVMGYGEAGKLVGSLSSPNAIRAGLWTEGSDYSVAGPGTSTHTLKTISGNTGKRAVIVGDNYANDFFVEFRDYTGDDAGFTAGATASSILASGPGVRILRAENSNSQKGRASDASELVGRTVSGVKRADYKVGESFSNGGVTVTVQSITAGQAVIKVTRAKHKVVAGTVTQVPSASYKQDGYSRVGDRVAASLGATWRADSYSYQWYRSNTVGSNFCSTSKKTISGATKSTYSLTASDLNKCLWVKVTGKIKGQSSKSKTSNPFYGAQLNGVIDTPGSVTVDSSGSTLRAVPGGWANLVLPLKYQWLRDGVAIKNATKVTYKPTSADRNKNLQVRATFSTSGYTVVSPGTTVATSTAAKYSVDPTTVRAIAGSEPRLVGQTLTTTAVSYTRGTGGAAVSPTLSYQWLRNGKAIKNAKAATYTLTAADFGKRISVKVTAKSGGLLAHTATTAATGKVGAGVIAGTKSAPVITKAPSPGRTLTAALPVGSITEPGVKVAWQWLRDGKTISKATKSTYTPTSSDFGKVVTVRATVTKSRYGTLKLTSVSGSPTRDSLQQTWSERGLNGTLQVGNTLSPSARSYVANSATVANNLVETYQWLRSGKAIKNATAETYMVQQSDVGKTLSVKITYKRDGFLGSSTTSLATPKVGTDSFSGAPSLQQQRNNRVLVTADAPLTPGGVVLTAPAPGTASNQDGVGDLTAKRSYQWYRAGKAISKATKSTYKPTSSDRGKALHVRVIISKAGFSEVIRTSVPLDHSVKSAPVTISGSAKVGQTLTVTHGQGLVQRRSTPFEYAKFCKSDEASSMPNQSTFVTNFCDGSADVVMEDVQWFRNGKQIISAVGTTYVLTAADRGKTIQAKVAYMHNSGTYLTTTVSAPAKKIK